MAKTGFLMMWLIFQCSKGSGDEAVVDILQHYDWAVTSDSPRAVVYTHPCVIRSLPVYSCYSANGEPDVWKNYVAHHRTGNQLLVFLLSNFLSFWVICQLSHGLIFFFKSKLLWIFGTFILTYLTRASKWFVIGKMIKLKAKRIKMFTTIPRNRSSDIDFIV